MKHIYHIVIIITLLLLTEGETTGQNERFKALFVYNFTKNIEWPSDYNEGYFVITVLGNSPMYTELAQNVNGKRVGNQIVKVVQANNLSSVGKCQILYIPAAQSNLLEAATHQLIDKPSVIITEKNGMIKNGADINIIQVDGKIQFEINPKQLDDKNLRVATALIKLGIVQNRQVASKPLQLESIEDTSVPR